MQERTTVRLPSGLLDAARRKAAAEGRTLTSLIEDGLREVLTEEPKSRERKRVQIPVSTVTGGYRPGMEHLTFSQLEELDDLEYINRLESGFK
jgi:hypothetical protein